MIVIQHLSFDIVILNLSFKKDISVSCKFVKVDSTQIDMISRRDFTAVIDVYLLTKYRI